MAPVVSVMMDDDGGYEDDYDDDMQDGSPHALCGDSARVKRRRLLVEEAENSDMAVGGSDGDSEYEDVEDDGCGDGDDTHEEEDEDEMEETTTSRGKRKRGTKKESEKQRRTREEREKRKHIRNEVAPMAPRTFDSWTEFNNVWNEYKVDNLVCYRRRDASLTATWNAKRKKPIPTTFEYARVVMYCTHGCLAESRATGERVHQHMRFTGCEARFTATVSRLPKTDSDGKVLRDSKNQAMYEWQIGLTGERTVHNHPISPEIFAHYVHSALIGEEELQETVGVLEATRTKTKQIASYVSHRVGYHVTTQRIRNMIAGRLGGSTAEARMKQLISEYLQVDGNRCAFLQDADDMTVGVILQSRMQAETFAKWPGTLVLDWTYNTNNLGFHLGALMVTSATGRGLPVCEFLSTTESKPALTAILEHFKSLNPSWVDIEAFIIDKDFTEIIVIKSLFASAMVFLCQFHVVEAVGRALARFDLSLEQQATIAELFSKLLYSRTVTQFEEHLVPFRDVVADASEALLEYFEINWIKCKESWSNLGRAETFSCGNTTTNRVESNWTQVKSAIGDKTGIDHCISSLIQHQMTVYGGLQSTLAKHSASSRTYIGIPMFLRDVTSLLSDYAVNRVVRQWEYYHYAHRKWSWEDMTEAIPVRVPSSSTTRAPSSSTTRVPSSSTTRAPSAKKSRNATRTPLKNKYKNSGFLSPTQPPKPTKVRVKVHDAEYTVDMQGPAWTCNCFFGVSERLPCQHMMYVSASARYEVKLPVTTVHRRWNMFASSDLLPTLTANIHALSQLRFPTIPGAPGPPEMDAASAVVWNATPQPKVSYISLKSRERKNKDGAFVLTSLEKRNVVRSELEELSNFLQKSSSKDFYPRLDQLVSVARNLMSEWVKGQMHGSVSSAQPSREEEGDEGGDEDVGPGEEAEHRNNGDDRGCGRGHREPDIVISFPADDSDLRECLGRINHVYEGRRLASDGSGDEDGEDAGYDYDGISAAYEPHVSNTYEHHERTIDEHHARTTAEHHECTIDENQPRTTHAETESSDESPQDPATHFSPTHEMLHHDEHDIRFILNEFDFEPDSQSIRHPRHSEHVNFVAPESSSLSQMSFQSFDFSVGSLCLISSDEYQPLEVASQLDFTTETELSAHPQVVGTGSQNILDMRAHSNPPGRREQVNVEGVATSPPASKTTHKSPFRKLSWSSPGDRIDEEVRPRPQQSVGMAHVVQHRPSVPVAHVATHGSTPLPVPSRLGAWFGGTVSQGAKPLAALTELVESARVRTAAEAEPGQSSTTETPTLAALLANKFKEIKLPAPTKGRQRARTLARKKHKTVEVVARTASVEVSIADVNFWAFHSADLVTVAKKLPLYKSHHPKYATAKADVAQLAPPFMMHAFRLEQKRKNTAHAALRDRRNAEEAHGMPPLMCDSGTEDENAAVSRLTVIVTFPPEKIMYSEQFLMANTRFYDLVKIATKWEKDWNWLLKLKPTSQVFARMFRQQAVDEMWTPLSTILYTVGIWFQKTPLSTRFTTHLAPRSTLGRTFQVSFGEVVGRVARLKYISGSVLFFLLNKMIPAARTDVLVLDPLARDETEMKVPTENVHTIKFVVQPQLVNSNHWVMAIVSFDWDVAEATIHVYDPKMNEHVQEGIVRVAKRTVLPLMNRWLVEQGVEPIADTSVHDLLVLSPVQDVHDGWNCGYLCIAAAYAKVFGMSFPPGTRAMGSYSEVDIAVLRLKCLHLILCDSAATPDAQGFAASDKIAEIGNEMKKLLK